MCADEEKKVAEKKKVAYALNLWTVSVAQIVEYHDAQIMEQEYNNILNNLNLEQMILEEPLLNVIKNILDTITFYRVDAGDRKIVEKEYQHRLKNAIWTAVPNVGAIFATSNPVAIGLTLATQVGTGYMNYRKNKAEYKLAYDKSMWELDKNAIYQLNALQKELFDAAWHLEEKYSYHDEYRLNENQINEYNKNLLESNSIKRYKSLDFNKANFSAYPPFWYQLGSAANSAYQEYKNVDTELANAYRERAIINFEKYRELNGMNLLRHDAVTSSWALEYLDLLNQDDFNNNRELAYELVQTAEKYSGNENDILELCGFAFLKLNDFDNATRIFSKLVNDDYNVSVNAQILCALLIHEINGNDPVKAQDAKIGYKELEKTVDSQYILPIPDKSKNPAEWNFYWVKDNDLSPREIYASNQTEIEKAEKESKSKKEKNDIARKFYSKGILIVHEDKNGYADFSEFMCNFISEQQAKLGGSLPAPARCTIKEYEQERLGREQAGKKIIFIGNTKEAKLVYSNGKNEAWDYNNLGMKHVTHGDKTAIVVEGLRNNQINEFIKFATEESKTLSVSVPKDVATVKGSFIKEQVGDGIKEGDPATIICTIFLSPLLVLGESLNGLQHIIQTVTNLSKAQKIESMQYILAFIKYLKTQGAVVE